MIPIESMKECPICYALMVPERYGDHVRWHWATNTDPEAKHG